MIILKILSPATCESSRGENDSQRWFPLRTGADGVSLVVEHLVSMVGTMVAIYTWMPTIAMLQLAKNQ